MSTSYEPLPDAELEAVRDSDGAGIPREAIVASQRFLAEKLLEAQHAMKEATK